MPMINMTDPIALLICTLLFALVLWFAHQSKKSIITCIMLFIFISLLVLHVVEFNLGNLTVEGASIAIRSVVLDLIFVLLSFISYLWIDNIEAKFKKKKVIEDNLDWFWNKI